MRQYDSQLMDAKPLSDPPIFATSNRCFDPVFPRQGYISAKTPRALSPCARVRASDSEEKSESKQLLVAKNNPNVTLVLTNDVQFLEQFTKRIFSFGMDSV